MGVDGAHLVHHAADVVAGEYSVDHRAGFVLVQAGALEQRGAVVGGVADDGVDLAGAVGDDPKRAVLVALEQRVQRLGGAKLNVVVEELIPEMSGGMHSNIGTITFSLGFVVMMILDVTLG